MKTPALKLVILDRDGTINEDSAEFVKSPDEWIALPGALEAIARLNHAGWHVVVASNQSGLGRGLLDVAALNAGLQKDLSDRGMVFNQPGIVPFRDKLRSAGFYAEWKGKYGDEAWALLEGATGKLA